MVKDLQEQLNRSRSIKKDSKLAPLDPDGKFGNLTDGRVREYQKPRGLVVDGEVGPLTRGFLFEEGYALISEAQKIAVGWVMVARAAAAGMLLEAQRIQSGAAGPAIGSPIVRQALATHFQINMATLRPSGAGQAVTFLSRIQTTYNLILDMLSKASVEKETIFRRVGRHEQDDDLQVASFAFGYVLPDRDFVRFTPQFTEDDGLLIRRGPVKSKRVNTLIHEAAHFVDVDIHDFAYESPPPNGSPGKRGGGKNYSELTADQAFVNGASYGSFAQHVILGADLRSRESGGLQREVCEPGDFNGP
jgi:hypothetical protein